ncbi:MAG: translation initiation factor IF-5A [Candidatus Brockarchaeota archaeon]|nr:translation initiation factor IF-5A [Candidatus Brockarchaeota archaeon]
MSRVAQLGSLKEGSWVNIDGEPCQVLEVAHSKTGKHGSGKARLVAMSLFTNVKKTLMAPTDANVEIPIIEKRTGQVISILPSGVQLMDLETYEVFETPMPTDPSLSSKIQPGSSLEYWRVQGRTKIMRVKEA